MASGEWRAGSAGGQMSAGFFIFFDGEILMDIFLLFKEGFLFQTWRAIKLAVNLEMSSIIFCGEKISFQSSLKWENKKGCFYFSNPFRNLKLSIKFFSVELTLVTAHQYYFHQHSPVFTFTKKG